MILVSFFFSRRALSKNLSRNGIEFKVTKFGDTDKQTDISHLILKDLSRQIERILFFGAFNLHVFNLLLIFRRQSLKYRVELQLLCSRIVPIVMQPDNTYSLHWDEKSLLQKSSHHISEGYASFRVFQVPQKFHIWNNSQKWFKDTISARVDNAQGFSNCQRNFCSRQVTVRPQF